MDKYELYRCSSTILANIPGRRFPDDEVTVYWYRVGARTDNSAPYDKWVADYENMDNNKRAWMRWVTDSYFCKDEIMALTAYLENSLGWHAEFELQADAVGNQFHYHVDKVRESQTFPPTLHFKSVATSTRPWTLCIGEYHQFYFVNFFQLIRLSQYPGYNLPFSVWGKIRFVTA